MHKSIMLTVFSSLGIFLNAISTAEKYKSDVQINLNNLDDKIINLKILDEKYTCINNNVSYPIFCQKYIPTPVFVPTIKPKKNVRLMCNADDELIAINENNKIMLGEFRFKNQCENAIKQFKETEGCFCGSETINCLNEDYKLNIIGNYNGSIQCTNALNSIKNKIEFQNH